MQTTTDSVQKTRWRIPIVLAVTVFVNFLDRNNIALAMPLIARDFGWTTREIGSNGELLLAAFFLPYALSNMLLSPAAERFSPKRSTIAAITAFSMFTILMAIFGKSLTLLIALRVLLGVGEGVHIPMLSALTSRWFLPRERSRANAIWGAGIGVATAIAPLIIVPLINSMGWRTTFAVLGIAGLLLSIPLVYFFVQDQPPRNSLIEDSFRAEGKVIQAPRRTYISDPRFWLTVVAGALNAFCAFGALSWLPIYFNRAKGIDFAQLGWPLAVVFGAGIVGIVVMAYLGDRFELRTLLGSVGFLIAGVMVYFASTSHTLGMLVLFFAIAVFFQSAYGAQEYAIVQRLLPANRVGAGTGLYNGLSVLFGGVGGSLIPGSIIAMTGNFDAGMLSIVVGALIASLVLFVLARMIRY